MNYYVGTQVWQSTPIVRSEKYNIVRVPFRAINLAPGASGAELGDGAGAGAGHQRCRMHGGMSPGAPRGNKKALKHGRYTAEAIARRREISGLVRAMKVLATVSDK